METVTIEHPEHKTRKLVKYAFEQTRGIKSYYDSGETIVGRTGFRLASYGESVTVTFRNTDSKTTDIVIASERSVSFNITANPRRYESRFVSELIDLSDRDYNRINIDTTNEASSSTSHTDGLTILIYIAIIAGSLMLIWFINSLFLY